MLGPERLAHYEAEIARTIRKEYGDQQLFVVKDPRICRLMPLWHKVQGHVGVQIGIAIPLRNPLETALSLEKRNGLPVTHGCLLWLRHVLEAEYETRGTRRVFVHWPASLLGRVRKIRFRRWECITVHLRT